MTTHVVLEAIDPDRPCTQSKHVIEDAIRGACGFDGLLMTDDLSMHALVGDFTQRTERALGAGCDVVLHCNGDMDEMMAVANGARALSADGQRRADAALAVRPAENSDAEGEEAAFAALLKPTGWAA